MELGASHSSDRSPSVLLSAAEMIKYRDERKLLKFTLVSGQVVEGSVRWFDTEAVHVVTGERDEVTILKHAILFYGPQ